MRTTYYYVMENQSGRKLVFVKPDFIFSSTLAPARFYNPEIAKAVMRNLLILAALFGESLDLEVVLGGEEEIGPE